MKIQFEAGTGRKYDGVNFLFGEDDNLSIYAEIEVPSGASEDYGYLTMKEAILSALAERGLTPDLTFWYDGQEQFLEADASADADVYIEIEQSETSYFIIDDNGTIYAHDIQSKLKANLILADILTIHPEYKSLNLEVFES